MSGRGGSPGDREDRLDEVVAAYLKELDSGVMPDRRAWLSRHPEFYDELSDFFEDREQLEAITAPLRDIAAADDALALEGLDPPSHPENLGRLGDYELIDWLGQGGMGVVFRGFDAALNRFVAIKLLAPQWSADATARKRFTREAQAAAAVSHPHVVTIHAVNEWRGRPYLVMEYINGSSLQHRIDEGGPLEVPEILRIGSQVAAGLAAAHAKGLIHRDIKPGNIMLENDLPRVKLTDFGLARAVDDAKLTQHGTLAGTPQYMAPEQARGEVMDRRADLFSLGSVLYAMCTRRPAFAGESTVEVIRRVCDDTPPPIADRNPEIPGWLVEIIERLHRKQPSERFQSAAEVADLLERHLARLEDPSLPPVVHDWAGGPPPAARAAVLRRVARSRWTGSILLILLGAAITFEAMRFFAPPGGSGQDPGRDVPVGPPPIAADGSGAETTKGARAADVPAPPVTLPPVNPISDLDESRLVQAYRQSFLDKQYDYRSLRISAPGGATSLVRPDPRGVRIIIPPKLGETVAIETKFAIHGDFDLRAGYEILACPTPDRGWGAGPEVLVKLPGGWDKLASLSRFARPADTKSARPADTIYSAAFVREVEGERKTTGNWPATSARKGTFRLVRTGPILHYLVAEGDKPEFRQICQVEFGAEDLEMARLAAVTGGSPTAVDVLWKDIELRAEALPGLPGTSTETPRPSPWLVLAVAVAVAVLAGFAVWTLAVLQRRKAVGVGPEDQGAAGTTGDGAWDEDGLRKLEEHAAAYAAGHPDAESYTERPRFAFSLRGGVLHGPFVVWAPLDKAARKRLAAEWEEICDKLPKRFEGGYRNGKRNGAFAYRNGSGKPLVRRYRDGELVG
jgi:serine/threonine-protein kinase